MGLFKNFIKMNNDLESLFSSSFDSENIGDEGWNVPSDKVWKGIENGLPKKKRRFAFLWFCTFALAGVGLLYGMTKVVNQNTTQQVQVERQHGTVGNTTKSTSTQLVVASNEAEKSVALNVVNNINNTSAATTKPNTEVVSASVLKNKKINTSTKTAKISQVQESIVGKKNFVEQKDIENYVHELVQNTSVLTKDKAETINNIDVLNVNKLSIKNESKSEFIPFLTSKIPEMNLPQREVIIVRENYLAYESILAGSKEKMWFKDAVVFSAQSFRLQNNIKSSSNLSFDGERFKSGYNIGLSYMRMLPNNLVFLELGLQHSEINYALDYSMNLPFNPTGETNNINGGYDNTYNGAIQTSQGQLNMKMVLQRQAGQNVIQGENIPISAKGSEKLTFLRIPFSVGASLARSQKMNLVNKISFNQLINTGSSTTFEQVVSQHSLIKETKTEVQNSPKPNTWTPEIGASIGLLYKLNKTWELGGELFYNKSLRPIYKTDTYSNSPSNSGLSTYLKYNF
jgi:hypothetical protein